MFPPTRLSDQVFLAMQSMFFFIIWLLFFVQKELYVSSYKCFLMSGASGVDGDQPSD